MSNSRRRRRAIEVKLLKLSGYPTGHARQRLTILAAYISGIVGSRNTHSREAAKHSGMSGKVPSREKNFERWRKNENVTYELDYLPYLSEVLASLSGGTLALAMDGSGVGRGCMTLMVSLIYNNRALPLVWFVFLRPKGHSTAATHIELLDKVCEILPDDTRVIFLGDGEFDSIELQAHLQTLPNWDYVCRTAKNCWVYADGEWFVLDDLCLLPDMCIGIPDARFTEQAFGPVQIVAHWQRQHEDPLYLVTSLELAGEACHWYRLRMRIETFFSDQKSRGFQLHKSHLSDPKRLFRLLIAACLAYIWMIFLGVHAHLTAILDRNRKGAKRDVNW